MGTVDKRNPSDRQQHRYVRPRAGFSMIEATVALSLIGVVLGSLYATYSSMRTSAGAQAIIQADLQMLSELRSFMLNQPLPASTAEFNAISARYNASTGYSKGTEIYSTLPGETYFSFSAGGAGPSGGPFTFSILHAKINVSQCISVISYYSAHAEQTGLLAIYGTYRGAGNITSFPAKQDDLVRICARSYTDFSPLISLSLRHQ